MRTRIINLTSKTRLNLYVSHMYSKELTETRNEAPKHRKELLDTEPYLTISLNYPSVLRSRPKGCRSKWKVENSF